MATANLQITGTGTIYKKTNKTIPGGNQEVTQLSIRSSIFRPGRDGGDPTRTTVWLEASAWSGNGAFNRADHWNQKYQEGDTVYFTGIPEVRTYTKADKTVGYAIVLVDPTVNNVPRFTEPREETETTPTMDDVPF